MPPLRHWKRNSQTPPNSLSSSLETATREVRSAGINPRWHQEWLSDLEDCFVLYGYPKTVQPRGSVTTSPQARPGNGTRLDSTLHLFARRDGLTEEEEEDLFMSGVLVPVDRVLTSNITPKSQSQHSWLRQLPDFNKTWYSLIWSPFWILFWQSSDLDTCGARGGGSKWKAHLQHFGWRAHMVPSKLHLLAFSWLDCSCRILPYLKYIVTHTRKPLKAMQRWVRSSDGQWWHCNLGRRQHPRRVSALARARWLHFPLKTVVRRQRSTHVIENNYYFLSVSIRNVYRG